MSEQTLTDSQRLNELIDDVAFLFRAVQRLKDERPQRCRDERVMKVRPGPQAPVNTTALSLELEMTDAIRDIATDVRDTLGERTRLGRDPFLCLAYLKTRVDVLLTIEHAQDLVESIGIVHAELNRGAKLHGHQPEAKVKHERRRPLKETMAVLHGMGMNIPRQSLWDWERRGHITAELLEHKGKVVKHYKVSEVITTWQNIHARKG